MVFLGLRIVNREKFDASLTELVYGEDCWVCSAVQKLKPRLPRGHDSYMHVLIKPDGFQRPLKPPYDGPFEVLE